MQIGSDFGPAEQDFPSFEGSSFQKWEKASGEDEGELAVVAGVVEAVAGVVEAVAAVVGFVVGGSAEFEHSMEADWIEQLDGQSIQIP